MQPSRCTVAAHEGHIDKTAYKDMFFFNNERYVKSLSQSTSKLDIQEDQILKVCLKVQANCIYRKIKKSLSQSTSKLDIQGQILKVCLKVQANAYTGRSNILPLIQQYNLLHLPLPRTLAAVSS